MTISLREEQAEWIEEKSGDDGEYGSKSEAIRNLIDRHESLQSEIDNLERQVNRLENEKRLILEQREEHTDLVRSIQRDQTLAERKSRANILTRWKWKITGIPDEE